MFDRVPFRRSWGEVSHRDDQLELVRQELQRQLPLPFAMVVGTSAVDLDQQTSDLRVTRLSSLKPPATNRQDLECRCFSGSADHNQTVVACQVVDSRGNRLSRGPRGIVVVQHLSIPLAPASPGILEFADQFLFLGIDADYGPFFGQKQLPQPNEIPELSIPIRIVETGFPLATCAQRKVQLSQQSTHRGGSQARSMAPKGLAEFPQRTVGPVQIGDRIACGVVAQQFLQGPHNPGCWVSTRYRPAPGRRSRGLIEPVSHMIEMPSSCSSRRPLAIVLRSNPVMRARPEVPPRPICSARNPTSNRRTRSLLKAKSRF